MRSSTTPIVVTSPTPKTEPTTTVPADWKRVEVADKFVFYMPADMKTTEPIGDYYGPHVDYANRQLMWNYQYASVDLCRSIEWMSKDPTHRETELYIDGKKAKVDTWTATSTGHYYITACLSDIDGLGTHLHLGAVSKEQPALEVARQIFSSIQFRKGAT